MSEVIFMENDTETGVLTTKFDPDSDNIYDLMELFTQFCQSVGYTYVNRIGYESDTGGIYWGRL